MLGFWRVPIRKNCMAWGKDQNPFWHNVPGSPHKTQVTVKHQCHSDSEVTQGQYSGSI